eukprot:scaffold46111_cov32-Tisochrysis_lutea.AAC.2
MAGHQARESHRNAALSRHEGCASARSRSRGASRPPSRSSGITCLGFPCSARDRRACIAVHAEYVQTDLLSPVKPSPPSLWHEAPAIVSGRVASERSIAPARPAILHVFFAGDAGAAGRPPR